MTISERKEILKLADININIVNPIWWCEVSGEGIVNNVFDSKFLTEFAGSDPKKVSRIAVFAHKDQMGLWGDMTSIEPFIAYGWYEFSSKRIDFIWQRELACRMCEGDNWWKLHEERGVGLVIRLVFVYY